MTETLPPSTLPLTGVRVLDLSRVLAGPYCCMLLSMLGAEVIKVEDHHGDESRTWPPMGDHFSGSFLGLNLNKRGIVVDLKTDEGAALVKALAKQSDVLVENFKTGTMERFGLDFDALSAENPRLVYTSVSAFGRKGPKASDPGYEALVQAYSGVMHMTGHPDGDPARCGVSFLDMATGISSAFATVSALYRREHTGRGGKVEASLLQTALGLMSHQVSNFFQHGTVPGRIGTAHPSVVPYQAFPTANGNIFIASANQNLWERLSRAMGLEHLLEDPRFANNPARVEHRDALVAILQDTLTGRTTEDWIPDLMAAGVPCAPVNDLRQVLEDGQVDAIGALASLSDGKNGDLHFTNLPFFLDGEEGRVEQRAPRLGEHTRGVLADLGYDESRIEALISSGVVRCE